MSCHDAIQIVSNEVLRVSDMDIGRRCLLIGLSCLFAVACAPESAEPADTDAAVAASTNRDVYGNPDLNGIWQAMGTAHRDIEARAIHGPNQPRA